MYNIYPVSIYRWRTLARLGNIYLIRSLSKSSIFPVLIELGHDVFSFGNLLRIELDWSWVLLWKLSLFAFYQDLSSISIFKHRRQSGSHASGVVPSACLHFSILHEVLRLGLASSSWWILHSALLPGPISRGSVPIALCSLFRNSRVHILFKNTSRQT